MTNYQNELRNLTRVLLQSEDDYAELTRVAGSLNQLFLTVSGLEENLEPNREPLYLPSGKAIGPVWAGMCVKDFMRTKRFLRGVYFGIRSALRKFPVRPIRVLYAGTGPFATLALPLTTVFSRDEVSFTMLEINPESVKCLERTIAASGAEGHVAGIIRADAARYVVEPENQFQMVITETMQNALQKEPQVAITLNLAPQMAEEGILVPEQITVEAGLLNPRLNELRMLGEFTGEYYHSLGEIFKLNADTARCYACSGGSSGGPYSLPMVELEIPDGTSPGYSQLCLFTNIRTFGGERLTPWQSSLTMPKHIMALNRERPLKKIGFIYKIDEQPGFLAQCW